MSVVMGSVTGSSAWKVFAWLMLAFGVTMTLSALWNMNDTWFLLDWLEQAWDWAVSGVRALRQL